MNEQTDNQQWIEPCPDWVMWQATDEDGEVWGFENKPEERSNLWRAWGGKVKKLSATPPANWRETLVARPAKGKAIKDDAGNEYTVVSELPKRGEHKTPSEWCALLDKKIMDPDGWRGGMYRDFNEPITQAEFLWRLMHCTQMCKHRPVASPAPASAEQPDASLRTQFETMYGFAGSAFRDGHYIGAEIDKQWRVFQSGAARGREQAASELAQVRAELEYHKKLCIPKTLDELEAVNLRSLVQDLSSDADRADMSHDEFSRVEALVQNDGGMTRETRDEILYICRRAKSDIKQRVPIIQQRDAALAQVEKLRRLLSSSLSEIENLQAKITNKEEEGWEGLARRTVLKKTLRAALQPEEKP